MVKFLYVIMFVVLSAIIALTIYKPAKSQEVDPLILRYPPITSHGEHGDLILRQHVDPHVRPHLNALEPQYPRLPYKQRSVIWTKS